MQEKITTSELHLIKRMRKYANADFLIQKRRDEIVRIDTTEREFVGKIELKSIDIEVVDMIQ